MELEGLTAWTGPVAAAGLVFVVLQLARTRGPLTAAADSVERKVDALCAGAYRTRCQRCGVFYASRGGVFLELQRSPHTSPRWEFARLPERTENDEPAALLATLERLLHAEVPGWKRLCSAACMRAFLLREGEPQVSVDARFVPCSPCGELHVRNSLNRPGFSGDSIA